MEEDRILDRHNYSPKTLEVYEIMSAYYVDIFYNHLYTEAKKLKSGGSVSSITEGYKHTLNAFLKSLSSPKLYKKNIIGIHRYYINIGFASISFAKCVDRLTAEFIPTDYFKSLTSTQKMGVLRLVINQSMKGFVRKIVDDHIAKIIDYHTDKDNVRILQDILIDGFIFEREGMYQRFVATKTKTNKDETVNRLLAEKMQVEIKRLVKEKYDQKKRIILLTKAYNMKKESENKKNEIISDLRSQIQSLKTANMPKYVPAPVPVPVQTPVPAPMQVPVPAPMQVPVPAPMQVPVPAPMQSAPEPVETNDESDILDESDDEPSNFIEVNSSNINEIIKSDSEYLQQLNDSKSFNLTMDEGTTLDDFS